MEVDGARSGFDIHLAAGRPMSKVGVVTVTYNSASVLPEFFNSLWAQTHTDFVLFLVDSGSSDGTPELVRGVADPRLQSVFLDKNVGFAAGSNLGIKMALQQGCEAVMLLNNDTSFGPDLFQGLIDGLVTYRCDMTTPKMLYYDSPKTIWSAGGHLNRWLAYRNTHGGEKQPDDGRFDKPRRVSFTPFCCVLMRRGVFDKIGLLDESYFVYTEDADYCLRALRTGLTIWYVPKVQLWHKVSALTGHMSDFLVYYCTRNRMLFIKKHFGRLEARTWISAFYFYFWMRQVFGKDSESFWHLKSKAIRDGSNGKSLAATTKDGSVRVYVHLSYGQAAYAWKGPDRVPYGYHHAEALGCKLTYSEDRRESAIMRLIRRALRKLLGADVIHAYRNRRRIVESDIVWTHTEYESLALLALLRFLPKRRRPRVIAQSVHLFDIWPKLSGLKKSIYRKLLRNADALTVHSEENLRVCRKIFPSSDCRLVKFGVSIDDFPMTAPRFLPDLRNLKIASLGNDMHRDWETLVNAFGNRDDITIQIAIPPAKLGKLAHLFADCTNFTVTSPASLGDILELYSWADVVVVPLAENLHLSGITVILEAIMRGKPVVAGKTGGLQNYFPEGEIFYYKCGDTESLCETLRACISGAETTRASVVAAQRRIVRDELTSFGFAKRHVQLSRELLENRNCGAPFLQTV